MTRDAFRATVADVMAAMACTGDDTTLYRLGMAHARAQWRGLDESAYDRAVDTAAALAEQGLTSKQVRAGAGAMPMEAAA